MKKGDIGKTKPLFQNVSLNVEMSLCGVRIYIANGC